MLDLSCTYTTSTKMSAMRDVMTVRTDADQRRQQQQQQQQLAGMHSSSGYFQLGYTEDKQWSSTTHSVSQKPSWTDIHDIVKSTETPGASGRRFDRNRADIDGDSLLCGASGPKDDVIASAPLLALPLPGQDRKRRRYEDYVPELNLPEVERQSQLEEVDREGKGGVGGPDLFENIARAILQAKGGQILLADIYNSMATSNAVFRNDVYKNWRVRVRHVLSINSCFVKGKRAKSGRGFYWTIHPACVDAFRSGDISKRKAAQLVKRWQRRQADLEKERAKLAGEETPRVYDDGTYLDNRYPEGYVIPDKTARHERVYTPMTTVQLSEYDYYELLMNLSQSRKEH